jgi:hypothetical protein
MAPLSQVPRFGPGFKSAYRHFKKRSRAEQKTSREERWGISSTLQDELWKHSRSRREFRRKKDIAASLAREVQEKGGSVIR